MFIILLFNILHLFVKVSPYLWTNDVFFYNKTEDVPYVLIVGLPVKTKRRSRPSVFLYTTQCQDKKEFTGQKNKEMKQRNQCYKLARLN
jgi:hypothetical protein